MSSKVGDRTLTRKMYQRVKKMDHQQFVAFCKNLYEEGQKSVEDSRSTIEFEDVKEVVLSVKGIGEKRADMLIKALEEKIQGGEK